MQKQAEEVERPWVVRAKQPPKGCPKRKYKRSVVLQSPNSSPSLKYTTPFKPSKVDKIVEHKGEGQNRPIGDQSERQT